MTLCKRELAINELPLYMVSIKVRVSGGKIETRKWPVLLPHLMLCDLLSRDERQSPTEQL